MRPLPDNSSQTQVLATGQGISLHGVIHFANATDIFRQGQHLLEHYLLAQPRHAVVQIDLAGLGDSNTIALAVLVQWLRGLEPQQGLVLINVPEKLKAIIHTSNLTQAFGLSASTPVSASTPG